MGHIIGATRHAIYVYLVAFLGALGVSQVWLSNLSTAHGAEVALGPAAVGAAVALLRSSAPAIFSTLAGAIASAAPAPASALAPEADPQS